MPRGTGKWENGRNYHPKSGNKFFDEQKTWNLRVRVRTVMMTLASWEKDGRIL